MFGGWYTEKGCQYRFSFDSAVTSDITLYAKWDRVTTVVSTPTPSPAPVAAPTPSSASVATPTPSSAPVTTSTPSPAPAAAATKTATVKNAAIPQTSDVFPMEGLLALLAVGAVGFGAAGWLRKKHH
ncbi:InlB B-repeat-containing protein [Gemmiger sp.]|uniref:InlB B-repeat-containing protein n=1 Tax=Gemmiger sp. TaxID=2049027 RepID=UPI003AB83A6B